MVSWSRPFDDPIPLPGGHQLATLQDAGRYITELLKAQHDAAEWQVAMEALLLVVEQNGPTMFARIAMMRALHRHRTEPTPAPRRKRATTHRVVR